MTNVLGDDLFTKYRVNIVYRLYQVTNSLAVFKGDSYLFRTNYITQRREQLQLLHQFNLYHSIKSLSVL